MSTTSPRSRRRRARGFTLIELMVVLVIMATFVTAVTPSIVSAMRRGGLTATGEKVREMLDFSYLSAVAQCHEVVFNVDQERGLVWVTVSQTPLPWLATDVEAEGTRVLAEMAIPEDTRITVRRGRGTEAEGLPGGRWETISFSSEGRTEDAAIELRNQQGERYGIDLVGATGEVHGMELLE